MLTRFWCRVYPHNHTLWPQFFLSKSLSNCDAGTDNLKDLKRASGWDTLEISDAKAITLDHFLNSIIFSVFCDPFYEEVYRVGSGAPATLFPVMILLLCLFFLC